jgi:ATP phosphoribosyltransferase regulatory subunit
MERHGMTVSSPRLLPEGLRDVLPPHAEAEAALLRRLLDVVTSHGYERVAPPLVEFEDTLLGEGASGTDAQLFRMMDPVSQRMMALRADMTGQVARIAVDRLGHYARPLRLAYAGPVLRVRGTQLQADRQFQQAGAELVGTDSVAAAAEVIAVAVDAVSHAGLENISVDITLPDFVGVVARAHDLSADMVAKIRTALDAKDIAQLQHVAGDKASIFTVLMSVSGSAPEALTKLQVAFPDGETASYLAKTADLLTRLKQLLPDQPFTLDPVEYHGFQYQTWMGFSIFARNVRGEVGRGGAYVISVQGQPDETAIGFSIYLNGLVDAGAGIELRKRIFLGVDVNRTTAMQLRRDGWVTVQALASSETPKSQRCTHVWDGKAPREVSGN